MAPAEPGSRPRGIGTAVVFDWALTVQLVTQAIAGATGHMATPSAAATGGRLAAAFAVLALGEGVRRGVPALRLVQVAILVLITALGVASAVVLVTGHGDRSLVLSVVIELSWAPWLAVRLSSAETAAWFGRPAGTGGAPRASGPAWLAVLAAWSLLSGIAVAWSQGL